MFILKHVLALAAFSSVFAHPVPDFREIRVIGRIAQPVEQQAVNSPELDLLFKGNKKFREDIEASNPGLLKKLTDEGQAPPFMFLGCSDSRVSEGTIFNARPGTLFAERNIANQFHHTDANAHSVLSYAVSELGVKHVIVMGHYGCGGVGAAIATPPEGIIDAAGAAIQNWISPIREIYQSSTRPEIVELRERNKGLAVVEEPKPQESGFRALVEENVKTSVRRIITNSVITNHFFQLSGNTTTGKLAEGGEPADVFVHGWVYDIENGEIKDLGISVGPPGKQVPVVPFPVVEGAARAHGIQGTLHIETPAEGAPVLSEASKAQCEQLCQIKRALLGSLPR